MIFSLIQKKSTTIDTIIVKISYARLDIISVKFKFTAVAYA